MTKNIYQKGSVRAFVIIVVVLIIAGTVYYFETQQKSAVSALSISQLMNASIPNFVVEDANYPTFPLVNGKYSLATTGSKGAESYDVALLTASSSYAYGDLNGDGVADMAVIAASNTGGTGYFYSVLAFVNENGTPRFMASESLGDRIQVNNVSIQNGIITTNIITQGPGEPLCCGTTPATLQFKLQGSSLTKVSNMSVTIMVPADLQAFETAEVQHVQVGGPDPLPTTTFVAKTVTPNTIVADPIQNAAEAAAEYIPTQAGTRSLITYFKVVNGTAYILLNMDLNGWAGVSAAVAQVHPIVEKTLLNQPGITSVKFGPAPGDTIQSIMQAHINQPPATKTYINTLLSLSLTYPSDWSVSKPHVGESVPATGSEDIFTLSNGSEYIYFDVAAFGSDRLGSTYSSATNLEQYVPMLQTKDPNGKVIRTLSHVARISGEKAYVYTLADGANDIYFQHGNYLYNVRVKPVDRVTDQIVTSLTFTN